LAAQVVQAAGKRHRRQGIGLRHPIQEKFMKAKLQNVALEQFTDTLRVAQAMQD